MESEAPFTVGTDVDAQPRSRLASTKSPVQVQVDTQTPLLQGSNNTPSYGEPRLPDDSSDAPVTEPRKSWRSASVSKTVISVGIRC